MSSKESKRLKRAEHQPDTVVTGRDVVWTKLGANTYQMRCVCGKTRTAKSQNLDKIDCCQSCAKEQRKARRREGYAKGLDFDSSEWPGDDWHDAGWQDSDLE